MSQNRPLSNVGFSFTDPPYSETSQTSEEEPKPSHRPAHESTHTASLSRPSAVFLSVTDHSGSNSSSNGQYTPSSPISSTNSASNINGNGKFIFDDSSAPGSAESTPQQSRDSSPQRMFFPEGEPDDPYARKHRKNDHTKHKEVAPRFHFLVKRSGSSSASLSSLKVPDFKEPKTKSNSMLELKRFFKRSKSEKSLKSEKSSSKLSKNASQASLKNMPFAEDGFKKYGKIGRILGSGAGGSVRLMKRPSDGTTFAIKEFRPKHPNESQREYSKKVTAEFCIGSTLHHPNIIETLDMIYDGSKAYQVMEYCPYDFFAVVMSGKMSREEIGCTFKQILSGVSYLHEMGLAHRDLKLDNCVVTVDGIVKIIDFGSASVFKYPFESDIVLATGVVGSDPYLAPEVLSGRSYNPQPADIWSIAIIFCCMTLRRFPWKVPRSSDNSFMMFASKPTKEEEESYRAIPAEGQTPATASNNGTTVQTNTIEGQGTPITPPTQRAAIKGPWRLLRLLPVESRHLIARMLELDASKRATLEEIWTNEWFRSLDMCTLKDGGFVKAGSHTHTQVSDEQAHLEAYKK